MNYVDILIPFVGGLGMFIYGMQIMAQGLENAAGSKMKSLLEVLTKNKLMGVLLGAAITAVIQSSSATTVMVVGFVNAGIMNLTQAMGVIMGANVGTTVTGWLVSSVEWAEFLSPEKLAPIAVIIGVVIMLTGKRRTSKEIANIIVGFGLLFIGISTMSSAVEPLKEFDGFVQMFVTLGENPILGILAGALVTAVIQSSSASVGILQSLAAAGFGTIQCSHLYYHGTEYRYLYYSNFIQCRCEKECEGSSTYAPDLQYHRNDYFQYHCNRLLYRAESTGRNRKYYTDRDQYGAYILQHCNDSYVIPGI